MSESFYELALSESDEAADITVRVAAALNEIVDTFGPDAIMWIRAELVGMAVRSFSDRHGDTWIETSEGSLSMVDAPAATFVGWSFVDVQRVFGPLTQVSGVPLPVVHATSWWQRPLGWFGIRTTAWCGTRVAARRPAGPSCECRECRRAVDGER